MFSFSVSSPLIISHPDDVNVTAYSSVSFTCSAHGFGFIKIIWKRINYGLPITANVTEERTLNKLSSILQITKIVGYYSGQYYCEAENKAGKDTSQTANLYVKSNIPIIIYSYTAYLASYISRVAIAL